MRTVLPLFLLAGCIGGTEEARDPANVEYEYVLGYDHDAERSIAGGAHFVVDLSTDDREAFGGNNQAAKIHPALKGAYQKYDPAIERGESNWDIFASNWWPQSKNGLAWRWTDGSYEDLSDHAKKDALSPVEKYDLLFNPGQEKKVAGVEHWNYTELQEEEAERGPKHKHDEVTVVGPATRWELENHGNYQDHHPDSWWGHCNGWASYVTAETTGAPARDIRVKVTGGEVTECAADDEACVLVRMGDIEAMMAEVYFNDEATFGGQRCNTSPDKMERDEYGRPTDPACRDINAGTFHIAITGLLGTGADHLATGEQGKPPFIIDHNYDWEVWNFPVKKFEITQTETIDARKAAELVGVQEGEGYAFNPAAKKFVRVAMTYYMVSDGVSEYQMLKHASERGVDLHPVRLNYVLELDEADRILGGEWIAEPSSTFGDDSKKLHPDFIWIAVDHQGYYEDADDTGGSSDNPFISYTHVKALLDCANTPSTCAAPGEEPAEDEPGAPTELTCEASCGSSVTVGEQTCWCDDLCEDYGDCCADREEFCATDDGGDTGDSGDGGGETTEPGSCDDHCGDSTAVPTADGGTCYCDSACESYGDCCGDYAAECDAGTEEPAEEPPAEEPPAEEPPAEEPPADTGEPATCDGHCGEPTPVPGSSPECYCDSSCEELGDCCGDFDAVCDL